MSLQSIRIVESIIYDLEVEYALPFGSILSKNRSQSVVEARHIAMYLARKLTEYSYPELGNLYFNKDHSTIIKAVNKVSAMVAKKSTNRCCLSKDKILVKYLILLT